MSEASSPFSVIQDVLAVTYCKGIYRQSKVFCRGEYLYVQHGGGFVQLYTNETTSYPHLLCKEIIGIPKSELRAGLYSRLTWVRR